MDFKRIETIFFVVFLGVNLFLFRIYQEGVAEREGAAAAVQTDSIEKRLAYSEIKYDTLSAETQTGYYLSGEEHLWGMESANEKLDNNNTLLIVTNPLNSPEFVTGSETPFVVDQNNLGASLQAYLTEAGKVSFGSDYQYAPNFSKLVERDQQLMALQAYEGLPIYGSTTQISFNFEDYNGGRRIAGYRQTYANNLEPLREKQELISEKNAITILYNNNRIPDKTKIQWTELAYTRILKVRGKSVYVPVWFVSIATDKDSVQLERVNAITSVVMNSNSVVEIIN